MKRCELFPSPRNRQISEEVVSCCLESRVLIEVIVLDAKIYGIVANLVWSALSYHGVLVAHVPASNLTEIV